MKRIGSGIFLATVLTAVASLLSASVVLAADGVTGSFLKDPATSFVLENARLIDGTGAPARKDVTVIVVNGLITYVGLAQGAANATPPGAKRVDLSGHTILPGLVMMHDHINYFSGDYVWDAQPGSVPKLLLAAGVTTVRTAGSESPQVDLNLKRQIDAGRAVGPRLFVTGPYLNGPDSEFLGDNPVQTADEARSITAFWGSRGATSVKVYSAIPLAALRGAVEEANRRGMHVAGHLGELSCADAAEAGIHTIEHGLTSCVKDFGIAPDAVGSFRYDDSKAVAERLIALLVRKKVVLVATPPTTEQHAPSADELSMLSPDQRERFEQSLRKRPAFLPPLEAMATWSAAHRAFERDFVAAGGQLLIGADANDFGLVPGYADHSAIIALVRAGFRPTHVVRFATSDAADFLGVGNRVGTVAPGRSADLLVVKGDPDRRIEDIRNVAFVFKEGAAYDSAKLRASAKGMLGRH